MLTNSRATFWQQFSNQVPSVLNSSMSMEKAGASIPQFYPLDSTSLLLIQPLFLQKGDQMIFQKIFKIPFFDTQISVVSQHL